MRYELGRTKPAPSNPGRAGQVESRVNPKPTKREWIADYLTGLEKAGFTGFIDLRLTYNGGGIARVVPMRQDLGPLTHHLGG